MKNNTNEYILTVSKDLFNEFGVYNVPMRKIASEVGISQGNLNYHFKRKEDIIKRLFHRAVKTLNVEIEACTKFGSNYYFLFELVRKTLEINFDYKFLITDINFLVKDIDDINDAYKSLRVQRIKEIDLILAGFIEKGFMRPAEYKTEFKELALRMYILSIYSVLEAEYEFSSSKQKCLKRYLPIIISTLYPYMTKMGKHKYFEVLEDYMI
jgi:AcrR family transcriptional regulator